MEDDDMFVLNYSFSDGFFFPKEENLYSKSWYAIKRNEHIGLKYQ